MDYSFHSLQYTRDVPRLLDFLHGQEMGYPRFDEWLQRTEHELIAGYKQVIIAESDRRVVGDAIFQPHKEIPPLLEIKNMRVHGEFRMRHFGGFMMRQIEIYAREQGFHGLIGDIRADQGNVKNFLIAQRFTEAVTLSLYDSSVPDTVMVKFLKAKESDSLLSRIGKVVRPL